MNDLDKNELIKQYITLQSRYQTVLSENEVLKQSLETINKKFEKLERVVEGLVDKQTKSDNEINVAGNSCFEQRFYELEKQCHANEQYSRRDSLEIVGIDDNVSVNELENKVCDILADIDVTVNTKDIQACHRLWDNKRTIIKFVNRKTVFEVLSNRKKLALIDDYKKKIYINESLCPYYRFLHGKCKAL